MGNLASNCKSCNSTKDEETEEIKISVNGIDEPDPILREQLIQSK